MQDLVQLMAEHLEDKIGAPIALQCNDEIIMMDADHFIGVSPARQRRVLIKAKEETVRRFMFERIGRDVVTHDDEDNYVTLDELRRDARERFIAEEIANVVGLIENIRSVCAEKAIAHYDCFESNVRAHCDRICAQIWRRPSAGPIRQGVVYFIKLRRAAQVKIGFTSSLKSRLRSLRTSSPDDPEVLLAINGTNALERDLHDRFAHIRRNREWFDLTPEIAAFIKAEKAKQASI
jgi:hypothetical protein